MPANSFMHGEDAANLWNILAMFESIGKYAKRERLRFRNGFVASCAVREYTGKIGYFADPAAIVFALDLNREVAHSAIVQRLFKRREIRRPNLYFADRGFYRAAGSIRVHDAPV